MSAAVMMMLGLEEKKAPGLQVQTSTPSEGSEAPRIASGIKLVLDL